MPVTRRLLREEITYSSAKEKEVNILHRLSYPSQETRFFTLLNNRRSLIRAIVAHHLSLESPDACHVTDIDNRLHRRFNPGNADEKVRCEVGELMPGWKTTILIDQFRDCMALQCPQAKLRPNCFPKVTNLGIQFTHTENLPLLTRCIHFLRRHLLSMLGRPVPSRYVRNQSETSAGREFDIGCLLINYLEEAKGKILSNTWIEKQDDIKLRSNLYRDLSRIFLSLTSTPFPKVGSFVIDNNGFLRLTNGPLSLGVQELENEEIPSGMT
ncbi:hypothetical protein ACJ73_01104 [Blastomyces percursus]|uniref:Uncharacterized protein n=1 Tax=Blastomyces percursus TaxID=1658174 RepID=A0A1J9R552_9EURO|nr:hypothetical protein ACJ73_01104 [Blastomyces percursus]